MALTLLRITSARNSEDHAHTDTRHYHFKAESRSSKPPCSVFYLDISRGGGIPPSKVSSFPRPLLFPVVMTISFDFPTVNLVSYTKKRSHSVTKFAKIDSIFNRIRIFHFFVIHNINNIIVSGEAILSAGTSGKPLGGRGSAPNPTGRVHNAAPGPVQLMGRGLAIPSPRTSPSLSYFYVLSIRNY